MCVAIFRIIVIYVIRHCGKPPSLCCFSLQLIKSYFAKVFSHDFDDLINLVDLLHQFLLFHFEALKLVQFLGIILIEMVMRLHSRSHLVMNNYLFWHVLMQYLHLISIHGVLCRCINKRWIVFFEI